MEDSPVALLRQCAQDPETRQWVAFEQFFKPRLVAGITRALWRSHRDAHRGLVEELIQETYCRLLARDRRVLKAFKGESDGEACSYLMRIAESITFDRLRAEAATKRGSEFIRVRGSTAQTLASRTHDPAASPEMLVVRRDLWRKFWRRCTKLNDSWISRGSVAYHSPPGTHCIT